MPVHGAGPPVDLRVARWGRRGVEIAALPHSRRRPGGSTAEYSHFVRLYWLYCIKTYFTLFHYFTPRARGAESDSRLRAGASHRGWSGWHGPALWRRCDLACAEGRVPKARSARLEVLVVALRRKGEEQEEEAANVHAPQHYHVAVTGAAGSWECRSVWRKYRKYD